MRVCVSVSECVIVYPRVCVRACVREHLRVYLRACLRVRVSA